MLLFCSTTTFKSSFLAWRNNILDIKSNNSKKIYQGTSSSNLLILNNYNSIILCKLANNKMVVRIFISILALVFFENNCHLI